METSIFWLIPYPQDPSYLFPYQYYPNNPFFNRQASISQVSPIKRQQEVRSQISPRDEATQKKRSFKRRKQYQLNKCYKCPYANCYKQYASDLALNLHMKTKHRGGNKKDRDRIAKKILRSQIYGLPLPKSDIQLPPGYIETNKVRLLLIDTEDEEDQLKKQQEESD